jgi:rare lipoprotein A
LQRVACFAVLALVLASACARVEGMGERVRDRFRSEEAPAAIPSPAEVPPPKTIDVSGTAIWDGQPSLGGIWVAHPDASQPQRVRVTRNSGRGSVDGWLFRRESSGEGPELQVSSEAAEALGLVANEPAELTVRPLDQPSSGQDG